MIKRYPEIDTLNLTLADRQYSYTIPKDVKSYTLKTRGNNEFKLAFKDGEVTSGTGKYITIPSGACETENDLGREDDTTIYISCEQDSDVLEIKMWR